MIYFNDDYSGIAHKNIINKLSSIQTEINTPYGYSKYYYEVKELLEEQMNISNFEILFFTGGTSINKFVISEFLESYEAVISADTGHINVHETGAVEASGHKILTVKNNNGKLNTDQIEKIICECESEHMVKPKMIYISLPTETGSLYTYSELEHLYSYAKSHDLYLYIDGARLASALASLSITLNDLAKVCDAFYIGGNKCGGLIGDLLVIINDAFKKDLRYRLKNTGNMIAKNFIVSLSFSELLKDNLYLEIGKHENSMASYLYECLDELGFDFLNFSDTNQIFPIFENELIEAIEHDVSFSIWCDFDDNSKVIRLVTSFLTTKKEIDDFISIILKNID